MVLRRKTTHTASAVFLIILSLPMILIIALQVWQCTIQYQIRERLEKDFLETISVSIDDIEWKNKKEVSIHGRMFDIKFYKLQGREYILTGLFDDTETGINDILKRKASESPGSFINLLIIAQCFVAALHLIGFPFLFSFSKLTSSFKDTYSYYFKELLSPPPKIIVCF